MAAKGFTTTALVAIIAALAGIVVPIVWDLYRTRTGVEVQILEAAKLLEPSEKIDKLEIRYNGESIARVSRMTIAIVNDGRTPIKPEDFIVPISIQLPSNSRLLDLKSEEAAPNDLGVNFEINSQRDRVDVKFSLFNPGDYVRFSILIAGEPEGITATGRVVNVSKIAVVDRTKELEKRRSGIPWTIYPVALFSLAFVFSGIAFLSQFPHQLRIRISINKGTFKIPDLVSAQDYKRYMYKEMNFFTENEGRDLEGLIQSSESPENLDVETKEKINEKMMKYLGQPARVLLAGIASLLIGGVGCSYVFGILYATYFVILPV